MPKRWHHKSRNGCLQCKQKRIKCDETRPMCQKCRRASMLCEYHGRSPVQNEESEQDNAAHSKLPSASLNPVTTDRQELELMHHYSICTADTLAESPTLKAWFRGVPLYALRTSAATSAMFSVTAAHLAFLSPQNVRYSALANKFIQKTLVTAGAELQRLDPSQCGDLYLASLFISLALMAMPGIDGRRTDDLGRFLTATQAWRGVSVVFSTCIDQGHTLPSDYLPPTHEVTVSGLPEAEFDEMLCLIEHLVLDEHSPYSNMQPCRRRMYLAIVQGLRHCFGPLSLRRVSDSGLMLKTASTDWNLFLRLLREGDTIASLIAICKGVLYHRPFDYYWYSYAMQSNMVRYLLRQLDCREEAEVKIARWALRSISDDETSDTHCTEGEGFACNTHEISLA